jgi:hypothetical protein
MHGLQLTLQRDRELYHADYDSEYRYAGAPLVRA